jgi:NAD(P)-dependent dehydrogenase (short-subunit alcohol dehydrogenase family)
MSTVQRVAVITGASQGIGAALVRAFRDRNYRVVATSRSIEPAADADIATVRGVGGEFIITLRLASGTDRGNGAAKRSDQGRHGRAAVRQIVLLECCHRAIGERDFRCNKF